MKQLKKFLSGFLMVCLVAGLLPPLAASAGSTETVTTEEGFLAALDNSSVDTIVIANDITINDTNTAQGAPFVIDREVTISGQNTNLSFRTGGVILDADATFENITLLISNSSYYGIYANGHKLTLRNVSQGSGASEMGLYCGSLENTVYPVPRPGSKGEIIIQGHVDLGNIYAGSLFPGASGDSGNFSTPYTGNSAIIIDPSARGKVNNIYSCGAARNVIGTSAPEADASTYPHKGAVEISLYGSVVDNVDGTASSQNFASVIFNSDPDDYPVVSVSLSNIGNLSVKSGRFTPRSLSFRSTDVDLSVSSGAQLGLVNAGKTVTVRDFNGGGDLVLGQSQTLEINGNVSGTTQLGIGSLNADGTSGVIPSEYTYIVAPQSSKNSFGFKPYPTQTDWELQRDAAGNWTTIKTGEIANRIGSLSMDDMTFDISNPQGSDSIQVPLILTPEDETLVALIPLTFEVNGKAGYESEDGHVFSDLNLLMYISDNILCVYNNNQDYGFPSPGVYNITLIVPSEYSVSGEELRSSMTLTVRDGSNLVSIEVPRAIEGLKANGSLQTGVPAGTGYTLSGTYEATDAGTYIAAATPNEGYCWSDGSTEPVNITWSIAQADAVDPPAAPTGLTGVAPTSENGNGRIDGTTAAMEYAASATAANWTPCTESSTEVSPGTYYVRFQATANTPASSTATVTVPEYGGSVTPPVETVTSIQIITQEGYSPIAVGTQLSEVLGKLSLQVTYITNRAETIPVTADMINGFDSSAPKKITLQISYGGQTAALEIEVVEAVTPPDPDAKYAVTVHGSFAETTGAGSYSAGDTVTINAGTREGYTFTNWSGPDDVTFADPLNPQTTFPMPAQNVTITANWVENTVPSPEVYIVTVNDSYATTTGAGSYSAGDTVTLNAGTREGYTFSNWSSSDGIVFANASSASTTFTMPEHAVTVTANWTQVVTPPDPDAKYAVTVNGSFAETSGAGSYSTDDTVTINAGTREGYTFTSWSGPDSVALTDPLNPQTTFPMPAQDVTITANWVENTDPSPEVYTVTVNGSYADRSGAGNYPAGAEVVIDAGSLSGYSFAGWTSADVLQFLNAGNFRTSFTMPDANVSVTANWRRNNTGSSTGGSSSGGAGASGGSGGSSGSSSRKDKDDDAPASSKSPDQSLSESITAAPVGSTVNTTLTANDTKVGKTVFSTLAGKNASLAIRTGSVTWKINGLELSRTASYRDVDLGVSVNAGTIPQSALASLPGGSQIMQLALAQEGSYGMRLQLTVDTGSGNAGQWANFYSYSAASGTMQFRYSSRIAQDGTASLPIAQAADYAVVIAPTDHTPVTSSAQGQPDASFPDVAPSAWYSAAVAYASQKELMSGSGNGNFSPDATTTRGQLVSILYRLAGSPAVGGALPFPDTSADAYYADAVRWATQNNIVGGYANGSFGPSDPVTTEQLCTFLSRYAQLEGRSVSAQAEQLAGFSDRGQVSAYAADPVAWAVGCGIVSGNGNGQLMPKQQTSRAQTAVILMQFCENVL